MHGLVNLQLITCFVSLSYHSLLTQQHFKTDLNPVGMATNENSFLFCSHKKLNLKSFKKRCLPERSKQGRSEVGSLVGAVCLVNVSVVSLWSSFSKSKMPKR